MKKSNLVLFATVAMALGGLVGCGGGGKSSGECKHKWVDDKIITEATCAQEGSKQQKCEKCGETQTKKISKKSHDYQDQPGGTPATCDTAGSKIQKCSGCGDTKEVTIPATGHKWSDVAGGTAATCDTAGTQKQKCDTCGAEQEVDVPAKGHQWVNIEGGTAATCDTAGTQKQKCSVCNDEQEVDVPAKGHNIVCDDDGTQPEAGKAKVRMYNCTNDCGTTYFGFKASEVTEESKTHLVIGDDGGARFWGRPIGNDVALNDSGDPSQDAHDPVFNENQPGDFFEYKFDLTQEQVSKLGGKVLLYCDAKPAQYLGINGIDFWANKAGDEDWTRGMYIEGENKGQEITDYRYVLYVDGVRKDFDPEMKTPVDRSEPRTDYILPYVFNLHTGENTIRLVMAGGYRSTFYNFTFRAAEQKEEPAEPEVVKAWNGSEIVGSDAGNKKSVKFNASDAENVDIWKLGKEKTLTVEYTAAKAEKVLFRVQATTKTSNAAKCGIYCQPKFDGNSGVSAPYNVKYQVSLNGANIANPVENVTETDADTTTVTTAKSLGMTTDSAASDSGTLAQPVWFTWAEINLVQGKNTIVLTKPNDAGYSLYFVGFAIAK